MTASAASLPRRARPIQPAPAPPQFMWVETLTGMPIAAAVADLLVSASRAPLAEVG